MRNNVSEDDIHFSIMIEQIPKCTEDATTMYEKVKHQYRKRWENPGMKTRGAYRIQDVLASTYWPIRLDFQQGQPFHDTL